MTIPVRFLAFVLIAAALRAGTIRGTVRAEGPPVPESSGDADAYASPRYRFLERVDYEHLRDFVVYIDQPVPGAPPQPPPVAVVKQEDATFVPHVLPIVVGTTVEWPNMDDIYHNVFSISEPNQFNLGYYKSDAPPKRITFTHPGKVDVFCGIHSKMHCVLLVLENQFFALADARGRYVIRDVPAGVYKLRAWHERLPGHVKEITVPATGEVVVDFTLGFPPPSAPNPAAPP